MAKHVNIEHEVDPDVGEDDVHVEKTGENTYRLKTGDPEKHEFSKFRNKRKAFDEKFVEKYNSVAENDDRFDLGRQDSRDSLRGLRRNLKEGGGKFDLKVRD